MTREQKARKPHRKRSRLFVTIIVTAALALLFVLPLVTLLAYSLLKPDALADALASGDFLAFLGKSYSFDQYYELLIENYPFMAHFWRSLLYAGATTGITIVVSVPTAFLFAKVQWKGRDAIFFFYIVLMMLPYQVLMVPLYKQFSDGGLLNNPLAIILPAAFQPFWVFMLRQFAKSIPDSLMDAMKLETNSVLNFFRYLIIPLLGDCILALAVLSFADNWNLYEPALIMLETKELFPLPIILSKLLESDMGIAFSASVVYILPAAVLFIGAKEKLAKGVEVMKW